MPIQTVETRRLYRQISEQLRSLIEAGEFPAGSRLPAERDLAAQLGVSRPSLREALIALEVEGFIEVRMGSGIYVVDTLPSASPAPDLSAEEGPLELIQARMMLEGEVAALAARSGRKPQFDAIAEAIDAMEAAAATGTVPIEADALFHARVAEATGNSVLVGVVRRLFDLRLGPLFDQLHSHFETPEVWADAIAEHRQVLKALRARDADAARAAMQEHMRIAYKRLSSSVMAAPKKAASRATKAAPKSVAKAAVKTVAKDPANVASGAASKTASKAALKPALKPGSKATSKSVRSDAGESPANAAPARKPAPNSTPKSPKKSPRIARVARDQRPV